MKRYYQIQSAVIAGGTAFSWYTVVVDFMRFFDFHGTLFKVNDCIIPNPVTTPCFWGAIGFLVALIWSIKILRKTDPVKQGVLQKYLMWFLIGGTIFGWSNMAILFQRFIASQGKPTIGCSGLLMTNPFTTPCFYGSALFLLSLIVSIIVYLRARKLDQSQSSQGHQQPTV